MNELNLNEDLILRTGSRSQHARFSFVQCVLSPGRRPACSVPTRLGGTESCIWFWWKDNFDLTISNWWGRALLWIQFCSLVLLLDQHCYQWIAVWFMGQWPCTRGRWFAGNDSVNLFCGSCSLHGDCGQNPELSVGAGAVSQTPSTTTALPAWGQLQKNWLHCCLFMPCGSSKTIPVCQQLLKCERSFLGISICDTFRWRGNIRSVEVCLNVEVWDTGSSERMFLSNNITRFLQCVESDVCEVRILQPQCNW